MPSAEDTCLSSPAPDPRRVPYFVEAAERRRLRRSSWRRTSGSASLSGSILDAGTRRQVSSSRAHIAVQGLRRHQAVLGGRRPFIAPSGWDSAANTGRMRQVPLAVRQALAETHDACAAAVDTRSSRRSNARYPTPLAHVRRRHLSFVQTRRQTHSPVSRSVPDHPAGHPGYVRPQVILELGSSPTSGHRRYIVTHGSPRNSSFFTARPAALSPSRSNAPSGRRSPSCTGVPIGRPRNHAQPALARCYDVCQMAASSAGQRALKDLDLLARVVRHSEPTFSPLANYAAAKPGSLRWSHRHRSPI